MRAYLKKAIEAHAIAEYPRECCGLIIADGNKQKYIPCRNVAENDHDFKLHPEDYANAEEQGQVLAVVHSHIDRNPLPTEADKVGCEASGLPWHIVAVHDGEINSWHYFEPTGYQAPLVGREFHHGVLDCYTLIRDFYQRELNIVIPDFERPDDWWNKPECGEIYLDNFSKAGFVRVDDEPRYGDVILMQYRSERTNHGGVYLGDKGLKEAPDLFPVPNALLHHAMPRLSERVPYAGYWADITRMVVRHKDMLDGKG
ncbi:C40 family peptidase [Oligella urethralis]|uniref:C40 family peptidase n=1 Tax=Oligella urethralis TaxID=90245 RepID=UPI0024313003|nr:Mov34/MPN/PAD-1 family protein [Oligella urethralis]